MGNALTTFDFNSNSIRVIDVDGEPWFTVTDVCRALCFSVKSNGSVNSYNAIKPLATDEKATYQISGVRGLQRTSIISESGLYKLIMRSDKPEARSFQDWVTRVVLPAIRKTGGYVVGEEKVASGDLNECPCVLGVKNLKASIYIRWQSVPPFAFAPWVWLRELTGGGGKP